MKADINPWLGLDFDRTPVVVSPAAPERRLNRNNRSGVSWSGDGRKAAAKEWYERNKDLVIARGRALRARKRAARVAK
jgi:hypothetical protein